MFHNILGKLKEIFMLRSTIQNFSDGSKLHILHRYALRYEKETHSLDIGFEMALESGVDRIIHSKSIYKWNFPHEAELLSLAEQKDILEKIKFYCESRNLAFRIEE